MIEEFLEKDLESPLTTRLVQGISRGERMDYTLQKAVELGVTEIVPVITERTVVRLDSGKTDKRLARWRAIVISACEQSGRTAIPVVARPLRLDKWFATPLTGTGVLLDPRSDIALAGISIANRSLTVLIGPEGGLSELERASAYRQGYVGASLGPRILRTETAAVAALAILQGTFGDAAPG